jgi:molybdenum cofactor guanylyltransferase
MTSDLRPTPPNASLSAASAPFGPAEPGLVTGVILAGGMARRMGGQDKGLIELAGRPLVAWAIAALRPQVAALIVNANRNHARYRDYGFPVVADRMADFQGPLAGFASALAVAETPWIVTVPCDGPCLAPDLVARLCTALTRAQAQIAVAADARRLQPVHALIPRALAADLDAFLASGERKIDRWYDRHRTVTVDFSDRPECFVNINSPEEATRWAHVLAADQPCGAVR